MLDAEGYRGLRRAAGKISSSDRAIIWDHGSGYIQTGNSWEINKAMRDGAIRKLPAESQNTVKVLRSVIDNNKADRDFMAVRYADNNYLEAAFGSKALGTTTAETVKYLQTNCLGDVITEKAFVSVSLDAQKNVFQYKPVKLQMEIPDGTNIYASGNFQESEAIMRDGIKYRLLGADEVNGQVVLRLRIRNAE